MCHYTSTEEKDSQREWRERVSRFMTQLSCEEEPSVSLSECEMHVPCLSSS